MLNKTSALTLAIAALIGAPAQASLAAEPAGKPADPAPAASSKTERIEVVGSRIKRIDTEGASPVLTITAEDIAASGFLNMTDILEALPSNNGSTLSADAGGESFVTGASAINLRGMGSNRTLILINGKRQTAFPTSRGGKDNFVDVSDIPTSAVDRIEVLTGGASAIYGSDAVGGVVNIVLRKRFDGTQLKFSADYPELGDGSKGQLSLLQGFESGDLNALLMLELTDQDGIRGADVPWVRQFFGPDGVAAGDFDAPSSTSAWIRAVNEPSATQYRVLNRSQCESLFGANAVWNTSSTITNGRHCQYNTMNDDAVQSEYQRANLVFRAEMPLGPDWTGWLQLGYADKDTAEYKTKNSVGYTSSSAYLYQRYSDGTLLDTRPADYSSSRYGRYLFARRLEDYPGLRTYPSRNTAGSALLGLSRDFAGHELEVSFSYGRSEYDKKRLHQTDGVALLELLTFNPADTRPGKWYPLNRLTDEQVGKLMGASHQIAVSELSQLQAVLTGDLPWSLPGGSIGYAAMAETARESYDDQLDIKTLTGQWVGQGGATGAGERDRSAAGVEFRLPLLAGAPAADLLELAVAGRYDRYDDVTEVGGATTWQAGLSYRPLRDLLLRAAAGTTFRAPDMQRVYAGPTQSFGTARFTDSAGQSYDDSYRGYASGSRNLEEETGDFRSLGLVAELPADVTLSLDWWRIELDGGVRSIESSDIYNDPLLDYSGQGYTNCSQLPGPGHLNQTGEDGRRDLICIQSGSINGVSQLSEGVDLSLRNRVKTAGWGTFRFGLNLNYLDESKQYASAEAAVYDETREYFMAHWRGSASVGWSLDDLSLSLSYQYIGEAEGLGYFYALNPDGTVNTSSSAQTVQTDVLDAWGRTNLTASYRLGRDAKVSLGINNLEDAEPPRYDPLHTRAGDFPYYRLGRGYSVVGRSFRLSYEQRF